MIHHLSGLGFTVWAHGDYDLTNRVENDYTE